MNFESIKLDENRKLLYISLHNLRPPFRVRRGDQIYRNLFIFLYYRKLILRLTTFHGINKKNTRFLSLLKLIFLFDYSERKINVETKLLVGTRKHLLNFFSGSNRL